MASTNKLYVDNFDAEAHMRLRVMVAERRTTIRELLAELVDGAWKTRPSLHDQLGAGAGPGDPVATVGGRDPGAGEERPVTSLADALRASLGEAPRPGGDGG
jgi:hypothetical protein